MNCMLIRRRFSAAKEIPVTVTGRGDTTNCYAEIGGTKGTSAGTYTVLAGDVITFGVYGSTKQNGTVKIDGTTVLTAKSSTVKTYAWTVPSKINTINVTMQSRGGTSGGYGKITVITA